VRLGNRSQGWLLRQAGPAPKGVMAAVAAASPCAPAVAAADGRLSYADLHNQSTALAARLRALGVSEGSLVGLCVERSAALVVGALGIIEAGAAYVALDPAAPDQRLREMLADCGTPVVVLGSGLESRLGVETTGGAGPGGLALARLPARPADPLAPDLAYVVYTSGSTGAPKGVLIEQAGLANLVDWHRRAFALSAADRCTQVAAPGFDAVAWEIWPSLAAGASLHVAPEELKTDPTRLRDWLVSERITVSFLPTPLAEAVLDLHWPPATCLRVLLTGGDRLHRPPRPGLPFSVVNNYGVTEGTVVSTSGVAPAGNGVAPSIGWPIDGVHVRVVDDELRSVPDGAPGELLVGGVSLARGYLGRPELTAQRFVSDPDPAGRAERWYRTGDLVCRRPSGELEFLDRLDDQVKILGYRVEPGEIAATLESHPDVAQSLVVPVDAGGGERALVAYVRPRGAARPADSELRDHLARRLPTPMLPAGFVWLDAFPLTVNGKVDRNGLPVPVGGAGPIGAPVGAHEMVVAALVAELLELPAVGLSDNFILLGGHSLLAAQLMVRIEERFGVELPLRTVFDRPTVAEIAAEVRRLQTGTAEAPAASDGAPLLDLAAGH
jgi:amino acid adenylation domain-containing protein